MTDWSEFRKRLKQFAPTPEAMSELALKLKERGLARTSVYNWASGSSKPQGAGLAVLADVTGKSVKFWTTGEIDVPMFKRRGDSPTLASLSEAIADLADKLDTIETHVTEIRLDLTRVLALQKLYKKS